MNTTRFIYLTVGESLDYFYFRLFQIKLKEHSYSLLVILSTHSSWDIPGSGITVPSSRYMFSFSRYCQSFSKKISEQYVRIPFFLPILGIVSLF